VTCCAELSIGFRAGRYLATLQVDGLLEEHRMFQSESEMTAWTAALFSTNDRDLYVHLRVPAGARHGHLAIDLAGRLASQGMMIGLAGAESVCRPRDRRLQ
jgi:hypothetical protein